MRVYELGVTEAILGIVGLKGGRCSIWGLMDGDRARLGSDSFAKG